MNRLTLVLALLLSVPALAQTNCGAPDNPCWVGGASPADVYHPPAKWPEIAVDSLWGAATAADVDLSYRCIQAHTCHEGNPLNPIKNAQGAATAFQAGETGLSMWAFHRWRKQYPRLAYLIPAVNIAGHALGIWSYMRGR